MYWSVYNTHFCYTVALAPENVAVRGLSGRSIVVVSGQFVVITGIVKSS